MVFLDAPPANPAPPPPVKPVVATYTQPPRLPKPPPQPASAPTTPRPYEAQKPLRTIADVEARFAGTSAIVAPSIAAYHEKAARTNDAQAISTLQHQLISQLNAAARIAAWKEHRRLNGPAAVSRLANRSVQSARHGEVERLQSQLTRTNRHLEAMQRRLERAEAFKRTLSSMNKPPPPRTEPYRAAPAWSPRQVSSDTPRPPPPPPPEQSSRPETPRSVIMPTPPTPSHRAAPKRPATGTPKSDLSGASEPSPRTASIKSQAAKSQATSVHSQGSHGSKRLLGSHVDKPSYLNVKRGAGALPEGVRPEGMVFTPRAAAAAAAAAGQAEKPAWRHGGTSTYIPPSARPAPQLPTKRAMAEADAAAAEQMNKPIAPTAPRPAPHRPPPQRTQSFGSRSHRAPPGLSNSAAANRYGGFVGDGMPPRPQPPVELPDDVRFKVLHAALQSYDHEKSGTVARGHVQQVLRAITSLNVPHERAMLVAARHADSNGGIMYDRFVSALSDVERTTQPQVLVVPERPSTSGSERPSTARSEPPIIMPVHDKITDSTTYAVTNRTNTRVDDPNATSAIMLDSADINAYHQASQDHYRTWDDGHYRIPRELIKKDPDMIPQRSAAAAAAAASDQLRNVHYVPSDYPKPHELLA